jgi:FKBP-type peptidyl-prolyl cis-trans isomerase
MVRRAAQRRGGGGGAGGASGGAAPSPAPAAPPSPAAPGALLSLAGGKVKYVDLVVGSGPRPRPGHKVVVSYAGRLKSGKPFDSSDKFEFRLGTREVIRGWDEGIATMAVGGRRRLIIHPAMGYGAAGSPPVIPPNATLIFDVTLIKAL